MLSTKIIARATIRVNQPAFVQHRNIGTTGGLADKVTGAIKEKLGWATGNDKMQSEGSAEKSRGDSETNMGKTESAFNQNNQSSNQSGSSGSQMKSGESSNNSGSEGKSQSGAWNPNSNSGGGWNQSKGQTEGWNASGQPEAMQMGKGQEGTKDMKGQADGLRKETGNIADGWNHTKGQEGWNSQTKGPSDAWNNTIALGEDVKNKASSQNWDSSKGSKPGLQNKGPSDGTWGKTEHKTSVNVGSEDALSNMKADNLGTASWNNKSNNDMGGSINENILRNQATSAQVDQKTTAEAKKGQSDIFKNAGNMTMNKSHEYRGATDKDGKGKGVKDE